MKRYALIVCATLGMFVTSGSANAQSGACTYSGWQPWWNIFAYRPKCTTPEEERLQHFWRDYYHALSKYYAALDRMDWVAYYKNHGHPIGGGMGSGGCGRVNYAPVFVSPTMQWAIPNGGGMGGACPTGMPGGN